jgi:hypothetical protein
VPAVFGKIGAGKQSERRADADADHGHDDRAGDGVWRPPSTGGGVFSVNLQGEPGDAVVEA